MAILIFQKQSIRFALRESFTSCGYSPNDENTLSYEAYAKDPDLAYTDFHRFNSCDIITNQLWSNYSNIIVKVLKNDGTQGYYTNASIDSKYRP